MSDTFKLNPFTGRLDDVGTALAIGSAVSSGTAGSILYLGTAGILAQDNANFFWDATAHRLGVNTTAPARRIESVDTSSVQLRLSYTAGAEYVDIGCGITGNLSFFPLGGAVQIEGNAFGTIGRVFIDCSTVNPVFQCRIGTGGGGSNAAWQFYNSSSSIFAAVTADQSNGFFFNTVGSLPFVFSPNSTEVARFSDQATQAQLLTIAASTLKGLIVKGAASQSASALEVQNSSSTPYLTVGPAGGINLILRDNVGQTADLLQFKDSSGATTLAQVNSSGEFISTSFSNTTNPSAADNGFYFSATATKRFNVLVDSTVANAEAQLLLQRKHSSSFSVTAGDSMGSITWNTMSFLNGFATANSTGGFSTIDMAFTAVNAAGTSAERVRWTAEGRYGINTAAPSAMLHAKSNVTTTITAILQNISSQSASALEIQNSSGTPYFTIGPAGGNMTFGEGVHQAFGTTTGTKIGTVGGASGQKLAFYGSTPIVQPLLATGAGHTVDDVIQALQNLGLVRQS
jgi:hypothetical protein